MLPYGLLTIALTLIFVGVDQPRTVQAGQLTSVVSAHSYSAPTPQPCGKQLGLAGYSVTLADVPQAAAALTAAMKLHAGDLTPEFAPASASARTPQAAATAHALGLDRMQLVNTASLAGLSTDEVIARLRALPDVVTAEPVWLQSHDPKYLSCSYKLQDNATDVALAATARQALVVRGVSVSTLDDAGTMEFVSERQIGGRTLMQVAFVRRPIGAPSAAYVVFLDPSSHAVLAAEQTNWYHWA